METIYGNLTSVDIKEQQRLWDERGKGYYGEYLLLTELYQHIKGQCKILMNLNVPTAAGKTTEIDLLMIHETGLYVFEAKYYKGTIYGKYQDTIWTQYFRTQANSHFNSPIKQNEYHIEALKRLFPGIPAYSFIVFTNEDTDVRVTGWENTGIVVCRLDEIWREIDRINARTDTRLSGEQINEMFKALSVYAPIKKEEVSEDVRIIPLTDYFEQIKADYMKGLEAVQREEKAQFGKKVKRIIAAALVFCAVVIGVNGMAILEAAGKVSDAEKVQQNAEQAQKTAEQAQQSAEQAMEEFAKKFKQVEPMNGGDVQLEDSFLEVIDLKLEKSEDLKDTFLFSCKIQINGEQYGIYLHRNTSILVQMKDGTVAEYVLSTVLGRLVNTRVGPFQPWYSNVEELPEIQIFTDSADNIAYIKLTNVMVCTSDSMSKDLIPGIEFELYKAE